MTKKHIFPVIFAIFFNFSIINIYANSDVSLFIKMRQEISIAHKSSVEITINKGDLRGLSKFEIVAPLGTQILMLDAKGANFIKTKNGAKLFWMDLPKSESFKIVYDIYIPKNLSGKQLIKGVFYFIEEKQTKTIEHHSVLNLLKSNLNNEVNISLLTLNSLIKESETKAYTFSIQLGAYLSPLSTELYYGDYTEFEIKVEYDNEYYKYLIGKFYSLEEAKIFLSGLPFEGVFVVPYYEGKRTTVKAAINNILNQ